MGALGIIISIGIIVLMVFSAFWTYEQIKYSWKMNKEMNEHNATCYLERGLFNLPLASICTYNNTLIIERSQAGPNLKEKYVEIKQEVLP